ncbi:MAG TPA: alpha/beta hydrolase [Thermoclostridium caenicola]|uniref:Peptidase S9 prolyl oligopeptidase catalytic domain-containing protein n=1 Tax=Thermoclostridium caenicola TaxID=659425 RepID=A0A1M6CI71_9FIRM|nr:alpha/beta hydrolase [Thermoclostridium caenicola]SHI60603.1 hypothetical protein SAMN05444373_100528 [Thermoclostridium caenicola]HOK43035.1 alpha/beta hydrolase [Thermoclostridium caenicola]HOL84852.1 alpha/beta hydrolase [Thermoclostridium caenicola]HOP72029.1 alpha/beta hydrolase [Thermoclostridium caenicola]HPO76990.1 alpha/beta hydrolase [Thermoclostridium caenicola]
MQKAVEIQSRNLTLRGMLHVPDHVSGKVPLVCMFHGFTGTRVEPHFIFVRLSRQLEKAGIASVRFDFGGSGESDGDFRDMTLLTELEDAKAILDYARTLPFADAERIGVMGFSMGGTVASLLAGDRKEDVAALCLWAPAGNMGERILQDKKPEEIQAFRSRGWWDIGGLILGVDFLETALKLDVFQRSAPYDKRVLLVHGDKDQTVPLAVSERYLELYGSQADLHIVSGADHIFNRNDWVEEVLDYTVGFFSGELLDGKVQE